MKTYNELKQKLDSGVPITAIRKAEIVEIADNIDWVSSPYTGKKVALSTYLAYTTPYSVCHGPSYLSRTDLVDLLKRATSGKFAYKEAPLGFFAS